MSIKKTIASVGLCALLAITPVMTSNAETKPELKNKPAAVKTAGKKSSEKAKPRKRHNKHHNKKRGAKSMKHHSKKGSAKSMKKADTTKKTS